MSGEGILVKISRAKVAMVTLKFRNVFERGWNRIIAEVMTSPELAAVMPSREARTARYFFKLSQKRITKKIKNVPGKKIPMADINAPTISPPGP